MKQPSQQWRLRIGGRDVKFYQKRTKKGEMLLKFDKA